MDAAAQKEFRRVESRARQGLSRSVQPRQRGFRQIHRRANRACPPTSARLAAFKTVDPGTGGTALSIRPLPADLMLASRRFAGEFAGALERQQQSALAHRLSREHQRRDELLAGGSRPTWPNATCRFLIWCRASFRPGARPRRRRDGIQNAVRRNDARRGFAIRTSHNISGGMGWKWDKTANAWYCQHFWEHYAFGRDTNFLRNNRLSHHEGDLRILGGPFENVARRPAGRAERVVAGTRPGRGRRELQPGNRLGLVQ